MIFIAINEIHIKLIVTLKHIFKYSRFQCISIKSNEVQFLEWKGENGLKSWYYPKIIDNFLPKNYKIEAKNLVLKNEPQKAYAGNRQLQ